MTLLAVFRGQRTWLASERRVVPADDVDAFERGVDLLRALEARLADRERADREAFAEGHARGLAAGRELALERGRDETAARLLVLSREQALVRERLRESAASLALEIVRRIAGEVRPADWLAAQARAAAADLVDESPPVLRVSASRADDVRRRLDGCAALPSVVGDDALAPSACRLETSAGHVDVDLDTQLERLAELLLDADADGAAHGAEARAAAADGGTAK